MSEELDLIRVIINQQSIFSTKDYLEFVTNLVKSLGFYIVEDSFTKKPDSLSFFWLCMQEVDDYVRYRVEFTSGITGIKPVKVKRESITHSLEKGEVKVVLKGIFITDWQTPPRWESRLLIKVLKSVYDNFFMKPILDEKKKALKDKVLLMENEIKSFFESPRFM